MEKHKPASDDDEPQGTIEHIFRESGVEPKPKLVKRLVRFWEVSTGAAQERGTKLRQLEQEDKEN